MNELAIIDQIQQILPDSLDDDAFYDETTRQILTKDILIEGRHFGLSYMSPEDVGWKAAAVNLSDIAAMGGQSEYLLVGLGFPKNREMAGFIDGFYKGMTEIAHNTSARIVGGDTVGADSLVISVTATGKLPESHKIGHRNTAKPGDTVYCTGFSGLSAMGLKAFQRKVHGYDAAKKAHCRPTPQIEAGLSLSKACSQYSLMDTSDGLADAALKIAKVSKVGIELNKDSIPVHTELLAWEKETGEDPWEMMLYGGEDFQLLTTTPETENIPMNHFHAIGQVIEGSGTAVLKDSDSGESVNLSLDKTYQHL